MRAQQKEFNEDDIELVVTRHLRFDDLIGAPDSSEH